MELEDLTSASSVVLASSSSEALLLFVSAANDIPTFLTQSTADYQTKLSRLDSAGFFTVMTSLFKRALDYDSQLKILKTWDVLINTCSSSAEMGFLFRCGLANRLVEFPRDITVLDILRSYVTVLKGISMKLDLLRANELYSREKNSCPIYTSVVQFISFADSVTISAARLVVLNLCVCKDAAILKYMSEHTPRGPFEKLIDSADGDRFVFLSDLFGVAPERLTQQILAILDAKLAQNGSDMAFVSRVAVALADGRARPVIAEHISKSMAFFRPSEPVSLGLFLFALTHRLVYLDAAIKCGLVPADAIPAVKRFAGGAAQPKTGSFLEELVEFFKQRVTVVHTALLLRIFEALWPSPRRFVFELRRTVVAEIIAQANPMDGFVRSVHKQRCDLDFLYTYEVAPVEGGAVVAVLFEIEAAIARWRGASFHAFPFADVEGGEETFPLQESKAVRLTASEVALPDGQVAKLWKVLLCAAEKKSKKVVVLSVSGRGPPMQVRLQFVQTHVAAAFEAKLVANQGELVRRVMAQLLDE
jgi:hypothetical protein